MAKTKLFNQKSGKNRERVRRHRKNNKIKLNYQKQVQARLAQLYCEPDNILSKNIEDETIDYDNEDTYKDDNTSIFVDKLKFWAINHRISARAINDLLSILIFAGFTFLPKDSRTFMSTPSNLSIKTLSNGKMWYHGVEKSLKQELARLQNNITITLNFNFDGLPVFKSSNTQFWPILAEIKGKLKKEKRYQHLYKCQLSSVYYIFCIFQRNATNCANDYRNMVRRFQTNIN